MIDSEATTKRTLPVVTLPVKEVSVKELPSKVVPAKEISETEVGQSVQTEQTRDNACSVVTAICCFILLMLSRGFTLSLAPLVVEWSEVFDKNQDTTSWLGSVNLAVMFLTGGLSNCLCIMPEALSKFRQGRDRFV